MTDIKAETERLARQTIKEAQLLLRTTREPLGDYWADQYGIQGAADWLDLLEVMALEVYGTKEVGQYRDGIVSVTVITGTGGPHTEFTVRENGQVTGLAVWGSDRHEDRDTLPGLFEALLPLVEGEES